jgi:hypothetical protein
MRKIEQIACPHLGSKNVISVCLTYFPLELCHHNLLFGKTFDIRVLLRKKFRQNRVAPLLNTSRDRDSFLKFVLPFSLI